MCQFMLHNNNNNNKPWSFQERLVMLTKPGCWLLHPPTLETGCMLHPLPLWVSGCQMKLSGLRLPTDSGAKPANRTSAPAASSGCQRTPWSVLPKEWPQAPESSSDERHRLEGDQTGSDTSSQRARQPHAA